MIYSRLKSIIAAVLTTYLYFTIQFEDSLAFNPSGPSLTSSTRSVFHTNSLTTQNTFLKPSFSSLATAGRTNTNPFQLFSSSDENNDAVGNNLPMLLDVGTKGGALFLSLLLFILPLIGYNIATAGFGIDEAEAGRWIGVVFTVVTTVAWFATYIFRVATKDMTYAKQLKDYENAVIAKRLEELDEDEVQALVEDIERDDF